MCLYLDLSFCALGITTKSVSLRRKATWNEDQASPDSTPANSQTQR